MGQGLGKNSPVVLTLGRGNYEALITRHGQWVRYRAASPCACLTNGSPNIHCTKCGGLGWTYSIQQALEVYDTVLYCGQGNSLLIGEAYKDATLKEVYDSTGRYYPNATKTAGYISLNDALPAKGVYITATMVSPLVKCADAIECIPQGEGYYTLPALTMGRNDIEGLSHRVPCDILSIASLQDASGAAIDTAGIEYRANSLYLPPITALDDIDNMGIASYYTEPLIANGVKYTEPSLFVILAQNLNKAELNTIAQVGGDAMLTTPYGYDIGEGDIVTVLSGSYVKKLVLHRGQEAYDILPSYYVDSIISCDISEAKLVGANKLLLPSSIPAGKAYSVCYRVLPTYKVLQAIPQIRTSENQRMPRKCVIKLDDTYLTSTSSLVLQGISI